MFNSNNLQVVPKGPFSSQEYVNPYAAYRNYAMSMTPYLYFPGYQFPGLQLSEPTRTPMLTYEAEILKLALADSLGIFTANVIQRLTHELRMKQIPQSIFAARVLHMNHATLAEFISDPKPWRKLTTEHDVFETMVDWIMLCDEDQIAVVEGKQLTCCRFKTLKQRRELEAIQKTHNQKLQNRHAPALLPFKLAIKTPPFARIQMHQLKIQKNLQLAIKAPELPNNPLNIMDLPLTDGARILTSNLVKRVEFELASRNITRADFAQKVLDRSGDSLRNYLKNPKPWEQLNTLRIHYINMLKWIQKPELEKREMFHSSRKLPTSRQMKDQLFRICHNTMAQEMAKET